MRALVTGSLGQLGRALRARVGREDAPGAWSDAEVDWADLAEEAFRLAGVPCTVRRCTSAEWKDMNPQSADRPHFSSLANARLEATIGNRMRPWREALADYLAHHPTQEA